MSQLHLTGIVLRNMRRRTAESSLVMLTLALMGATVFTLTLVLRSADLGFQRGIARMGADVMVVPAGWSGPAEDFILSGTPSSFFLSDDVPTLLRNVRGVREVSGQLFIVSASLECCAVGKTQLIAYEPDTDFTIAPWITERLGPIRPGSNDVIIGSLINLQPGQTARFYGHKFNVKGRLAPTGVDYVDRSVFIPMAGAREMIRNAPVAAHIPLKIEPDELSAVLIRSDGMDPGELAIRIEAYFPELSALPAREMLSRARFGLEGPVWGVAAASAVQWIGGLLLMGAVFSLVLGKRKREIALYRVMGARRRHVAQLLFGEIWILSAIGGLIGTVLGIGAVIFYARVFSLRWNVPFEWPDPAYVIWLSLACIGFTLFMGFLGTWLPVIRAARSEPYALVRQSD